MRLIHALNAIDAKVQLRALAEEEGRSLHILERWQVQRLPTVVALAEDGGVLRIKLHTHAPKASGLPDVIVATFTATGDEEEDAQVLGFLVALDRDPPYLPIPGEMLAVGLTPDTLWGVPLDAPPAGTCDCPRCRARRGNLN